MILKCLHAVNLKYSFRHDSETILITFHEDKDILF